MLAVGAEEGWAFLVNSQSGDLRQRLGSGYYLNNLAFAPNEQLLALGYNDRSVEFWTLDGILTHTLLGTGFGSTEVGFSTDGELFSTILAESWQVAQAGLWNTHDWSIASMFSVGTSRYYNITTFELSPDQQTAAISYQDKTGIHHQDVIRIVTVPDGEVLTDVALPGPGIWAIRSTTFSPAGDMLAVYSSAYGQDHRHVQVWRTSDWELLYTYSVVPDRIVRGWASILQDVLAWSPDGNLLAVGVSDGGLQLLNASTGDLLVTLPGHPTWTTGVAFSPDGRLLASCSLDGTIMLWGMR